MKADRKRRVTRWAALCGLGLVSACVTINVYFPAAAAERAADRIIEEVWGPDAKPQSSGQGGEPTSLLRDRPRRLLAAVLDLLLPTAQAQQADLEISTPAINRIKDRMQARHEKLKPFYASGAIGLAPDGLIEIRDPKSVPLKDRPVLNALVAEENRDRNALYAEIARANGRPEWENEIRGTFAGRWVQNAPAGWWFRRGGDWKQK